MCEAWQNATSWLVNSSSKRDRRVFSYHQRATKGFVGRFRGWRVTDTWNTILDIAGLHSVGSPIHVYPLYENGFRAHRGQSVQDNHHESATLYAHLSQVASRNPHAWNYGTEAETVSSIGTISKKNRMICFPCIHIST